MTLVVSFGSDEQRRDLAIDLETGYVTVDGIELTPEEWGSVVKRVGAALARLGHVDPPPPSPPAPRTTRFVVSNLPALNAIKRGKVKNAPLILRPFYDSVITKEALNGTGTS